MDYSPPSVVSVGHSSRKGLDIDQTADFACGQLLEARFHLSNSSRGKAASTVTAGNHRVIDGQVFAGQALC